MTRALVLSGGGSVGIAWESGIAAGLKAAGVDLAEADFVVGTSAGSAVGAQIALGHDMQEVVERYRQPRAPAAGEPRQAPPADRMQRLMEVMAGAGADADPQERRAQIGKFALEAETISEDQFVSGFRYLNGEAWPARYACTAVDALTGEFVVWDEKAGADLDRAVASSCAVPGLFPPITIKGRRYIDGGMRSGTNADLAKGHDVVLILTLLGGARGGDPAADARMEQFRRNAEAELQTLRDSGSRVETLAMDAEFARTLGMNFMDPSKGLEAAEAGVRQGHADAERIASFWT